MALLQIRIPGHPTLQTQIDGPTVIGRASDADVSIPHPTLSRRHCRIEPVDEFWRVVDLQSRAGTLVAGELVTERFLKDEDTLLLGDIEIRFDAQSQLQDEADASCDASGPFDTVETPAAASWAAVMTPVPTRVSETSSAVLSWERARAAQTDRDTANTWPVRRKVQLAIAAVALAGGVWLIFCELSGDTFRPNPGVVHADFVQAKGD